MTVWLTTAEAAKHVRGGPAEIRAAVKAGDLPASRIGKTKIVIAQDDLDTWMKSRSWEPTS